MAGAAALRSEGLCRGAVACVVFVVWVGCLVAVAEGHAFLKYPPFRGMALTGDDYLRSAYNGLIGWGNPPWQTDSVCGDGGQSISQGSRDFWTFGKRNRTTPLVVGANTFTVRMRVWHFGRFEFKVCQYSGAESTATLNQACFDRRVLQPVPGQARVISGQQWWWVGELTGAVGQEYTMQYIIPADLSCDGVNTFCVLQWSYVTGNSCNPSGTCPTTPPASCKPPGWFNTCQLSPPTGEYFRNCADITVGGGGGAAKPPPPVGTPPVKSPSPPPPSSTLPPAPPGGSCGANVARCSNGQCCSKWGWCGVTDAHCKTGQGCQPGFGACRTP